MRPHPVAFLLGLLPCLTAAAPARAEDAGISPNVRTEYAQVLQVEPVYQILRAQAIEQRCDHPAEATGLAQTNRNCRPVRVTREYQRPVAYDVDYILRGVKYRSRLPIDPGKRLRLRITITPDILPSERR
jgi:uncharacterized protein YcfJ